MTSSKLELSRFRIYCLRWGDLDGSSKQKQRTHGRLSRLPDAEPLRRLKLLGYLVAAAQALVAVGRLLRLVHLSKDGPLRQRRRRRAPATSCAVEPGSDAVGGRGTVGQLHAAARLPRRLAVRSVPPRTGLGPARSRSRRRRPARPRRGRAGGRVRLTAAVVARRRPFRRFPLFSCCCTRRLPALPVRVLFVRRRGRRRGRHGRRIRRILFVVSNDPWREIERGRATGKM